MTRRVLLLATAGIARAMAQKAGVPGSAGELPDATEPELEFVCPMDKDVRSATPGQCPRCGMTLVPGVPDAMEYLVELRLRPSAPRAGQKVDLLFRVKDPKTGRPVTDFQIMHEKLYHMFIVSQDLRYFLHEHPVQSPGGVFRFSTIFPRPGMYRILSDVYPSGGTPQLLPSTVIIPGGPITPGGVLTADLTPKDAANLRVSIKTEPPQPVAGLKTLMFFHLEPADGLEKFIGAWGHMLAASSDLVDMIHTHPFIAEGGPDLQFNMVFPRPALYRVWVQFQRKGVVNTVAFNVPVSELK